MTAELHVSAEEFEATVFEEHAIAGHGRDHERIEWVEFDNADNTAHYTTDAGVHLVAHLPKPGRATEDRLATLRSDLADAESRAAAAYGDVAQHGVQFAEVTRLRAEIKEMES